MQTFSTSLPLQHFSEILSPIIEVEDQGVGHSPKLRRLKECFRRLSIALFYFKGDFSCRLVKPCVQILDHLEFLRCLIAGLWRQPAKPFAKGALVIARNLFGALFKLPPLDAIQKRALPRCMSANRVSDLRITCDFTGAHIVCFPKPCHVAHEHGTARLI